MKKILIVEDDPRLCSLYQMELKEHFEVVERHNGQEALEAVEQEKPDLVVMDIMMPVMDGLEALDKLRENPATAAIPVILLTAKVLHKDVLEGYKKGADYYITKPFTSRDLMNGIKMCLKNGRS
jgi:CheY-like chemotaxis protein